MVEKQDLLAQLDQADEVGGGTGRGVFCQTEIGMAFKSFAKDMTSEQTLFPYDPGVKDAEKEAHEGLSNVLTTAGVDISAPANRPMKVIYHTCYAASVVGSTWKADLTKLIPTWTPAWKGQDEEVEGEKVHTPGMAKEALRQLVEDGSFTGFGKKYWAHIKVVPDPSGRKDGNGQVQTIWFVDKIFKTEKALKEAAAEAGDAVSPMTEANSSIPDGWPADVWADTKPDIITACEAGSWKAPVLAKVAKDYDLTVEFLKTLQDAGA